MKYITGILISIILFSCSIKQSEMRENISEINSQWLTYHDTIDAGFILTFKYPNNMALADVIDNCRCVGEKIKNEDKNRGIDSTNTRYWCVCMQDTADYSIDYLISSWKTLYTGQVTEQRDSVIIDNLKALRVMFKNGTPETSYRQLVYLKKYSTLFEIMNISEATSKEFETFCKSISVEEYQSSP